MPVAIGPSLGIALLLFSLVCLGSWPVLMELCGRSGRPAPRAYSEFALAVFAVAAACALTLGEVGPSGADDPAFAAQLAQPNGALALAASAAGVCLMLGNLAMQRALLMGTPLSVTLPVQGALTVVLGTTANYALQPAKSDAPLLFAGVAAFVVAIALSARAHDCLLYTSPSPRDS